MPTLLLLCAYLLGGVIAVRPHGRGATVRLSLYCIKFTPQPKNRPETRRRPLNHPSGVSTKSASVGRVRHACARDGPYEPDGFFAALARRPEGGKGWRARQDSNLQPAE